jgi:phosphate butyryltransferase
MITKLNDIAEAVKQTGARRLVVVCAADPSTLKAVAQAVQNGIVTATLLDKASAIESVCAEASIDPASFSIIDIANEAAAIETGVRMVHDGEADILMKGLVPTDRYVRAILNKEWGLMPRKGLLSHLTVFEAPFYHKLLIVSDPAVIIAPDLNQKVEIAKNIAKMARFLGITESKIACIAASEQILPSSQASVEAAILTQMAQRGQLGSVIVEGPLSIDIALYKEVAETKKLKGDHIAGDVDGLLFPNIESANIFYKMLTHLGGAKAAPLLAGTTSPCILTSRADDTQTKFNAIALAAISVSK